MTEKQLIVKIQELRQIKPRKDWVVFTKKQILREEKPAPAFSFISFIREMQRGERFVFQHKPAFASALMLAIFFGLFGFAQNAMPGDALFSIKKITEKSQSVFISQEKQPNYDLEMVQKRLEDLMKIAQRNSVKNLAPAISEYQANVSKVAENIAREKDTKKVKEMVLKMKDLENREAELKSLGIVIGENEELDRTYAQKIVEVLEPMIEDLKNRSLTEEQQELLAELEKDLENKNFEEALIKLLNI
jgi:hypothetical protein